MSGLAAKVTNRFGSTSREVVAPDRRALRIEVLSAMAEVESESGEQAFVAMPGDDRLLAWPPPYEL